MIPVVTASGNRVQRYQLHQGSRIGSDPEQCKALVNGADGIGTGWSTSLPNHNPRCDVVVPAADRDAENLSSLTHNAWLPARDIIAMLSPQFTQFTPSSPFTLLLLQTLHCN